jgi:ubiquinone/menaquinone biosynthesis C-methylase UbiE
MATGVGGIDPLDTIQIVLVVLIAIMLANYVYMRWSMRVNRIAEVDDAALEGFSNPDDPDVGSGGNKTAIYGNDHLYDDFYAKVYDTLVDGATRADAETGLTLAWFKGFYPELKSIKVLDVGCGTGNDVDLFAKAGVGSVTGIDQSEAMIRTARKKYPKQTFQVGDVEQIGQFAAGQFNLISMYYFTYYYLQDPDMMFRNAFQWLAPGGGLVIHLVNRDKFDPILESASPFVAFSVQKYSKERISKSTVSFDKFDYTANFELEGNRGKFMEEFKFKNGTRRKQTHTLRMPKMEEVVAKAEANGFVYKQFVDLTAIGYEYQYLFCFVR